MNNPFYWASKYWTDEELEDYARQINQDRIDSLETQRRIFARLFQQIGESGSKSLAAKR